MITKYFIILYRGYGSDKEQTAAFRECFGKLGELRSLFPPLSPVLALTATATSATKATVIKSLSLRSDVVKIYVSPDRPNIYLHKMKVNKDLNEAFGWLVQMIKEKGPNTPRAIIYCKSQKDCGRLFRHFKIELGDHGYSPVFAEQNSRNMVIGMFHHNTLKKHQDRVLDSLFNENGVCRVVFASTALGMGVNIKDIRFVIHYGPPRHMDDFVQEMGRTGRDLLPSKAILLYHGNQLRKCDKIVKHYAKSEAVCLRQIILSEFDENQNDMINTHDCCTTCHQKCMCGGQECRIEMLDLNSKPKESPITSRSARKVTSKQKNLLKELLKDYKDELVKEGDSYFLPSECCTGFTTMLVKTVLKKCKFIFTLSDIVELTPVYKKDHAMEILYMIKDVFDDIVIDCDSVPVSSEVVFRERDLEYGGQYDSSESSSDSNSADTCTSLSEMSGFSWL